MTPRRRTSMRIRCWQAAGMALIVAVAIGGIGVAGVLAAAVLRGRLP